MSILLLQQGIIYGPVKSKRLGRSLGINILPCDDKVCNFDCIYCHFGPTKTKVRHTDSIKFPEVGLILNEVEKALQSEVGFEYMTFSGNGEPMLHPQFCEIAARIKGLKEKYRPNVSLSLLTNSSSVMKDDVANSIISIEFPIFKLDGGDEATFRTINRPVPELRIEEIIGGLKRLAKRFKITIQTVFIDGVVPNIEKDKLEKWLAAIREIRPAAIQIYSTDRPVADSKVKMLSKTQLEELAKLVKEKTGIFAQAFSI